MRLYFVLLIFWVVYIFGPVRVCAQTSKVGLADSLEKELASDNYKDRDDSNRVKLMLSLSESYALSAPERSIGYAKQALELAEQLDWKKGISSAYMCIGSYYDSRSDPPNALENYFKALKISEEIRDKKGVASVTGNIGVIFNSIGNSSKALEYYERALKMHTELGNKVGMQSCLGNIGIIYGEQSDLSRALEYFTKSLKINEELGRKEGVSKNLVSIGIVFGMKGEHTKSLAYFFKAMSASQGLDSKSDMVLHLGNIGGTYLAIAKDTGRVIAPDSLVPAGRAAVLQKAIEYLEKAVVMAKEIGYLDAVIECSANIAEAYAMKGDHKAAFEYYKQFSVTKDSVYSAANRIKITDLETKREMELKDKQIEINRLAIEKKRNERGLFIAGIVLLLLVIVFMFRNYQVQKRSNELLSIEKKRSEDLLLNILPEEVAGELKEKGSAVARHYDNVTVLFTDFVNFTHAGGRMSPEQLIYELDTCFKAFDEITSKYNIEKIKTIGDAYLAVCGLPSADPKHAENVVNAAIEINSFMSNRLAMLDNERTFEIRIGIHSGSVVAGIVGVKKFAYDIWGDTVNTAARMEQHGAAGKINISETTYELVKDKFKCEYRGEVEAKGKGVMKMYFVS